MDDDKRKFWKDALPETQDENFEIFINLIEELKDDEYYLFMLFSNTDRNVLKKHNEELAQFMSKNKENALVVENIWKILDIEYQKQHIDILRNIMDKLLTQDKDISKIWKDTNGEIQLDMLEDVLNKCGNTEKSDAILKGVNILLPKEKFVDFLEKSGVLVNDVDLIYELYQSIFKINKNVNETINLNMFDSRILDIFDLEKVARITTYPELQRKIVDLNKVQGFSSVIKSIGDDNWVMELDGILKNVENYPELLDDISTQKIDEESAKMLVQVFSQKENYFNIVNVSDAKNYFEIRKDICKRILNNEQIENLNPTLEKYSDEDRKRFAILEMIYGIDIDEAKNLVEKYGKDIEKIDVNKYGKNVIALIGIKRILESENISRKYEQNKDIIDNKLEEIDYTIISDLEASCIDIYSQMYEETLYKPDENEKIGEVEYEGTKIDVYEIQGDFNMFVRAEGACNGYNEPENFAEKLSTLNVQYHGNCKSFIGQDSIAIADSEGIKFGYSKCDNGTLLMSAPWDIMSNGANREFSTASEKWNINCGIQFRTPQEMINNTRHSYNEFDFEKLVYNEESKAFEGDKPQYIVYVKEPDIDVETDDKWRVSKKAAGQLGIPIVIIDREKYVKREFEKVKELQNILLGNAENKDNISEADLLENIIVKFENNVNSVKASKILSDKYFNYEQRETMVNSIISYIKSLESINFNKYQELFNKFRDVIQNETDKTISNTGEQVANDRYGRSFLEALNQKCDKIEEEAKKRDLKNAYLQAGIEMNDLREARAFLENEKNKEQEQSVRNK